MKARLKETGIIIELDEYCYDLNGNEYKWDELDLMIEPDWSSFRRETAKDILANVAGQLVHDPTTIAIDKFDPEFYAKVAVEWADALIAKLKEK